MTRNGDRLKSGHGVAGDLTVRGSREWRSVAYDGRHMLTVGLKLDARPEA